MAERNSRKSLLYIGLDFRIKLCYIGDMNTLYSIVVMIAMVILIAISGHRLDTATTELEAIKQGIYTLVWAIFLALGCITMMLDEKP